MERTASDEDTAEILERYRRGDAHAAEDLFARYVERLTRLARSRLSAKLASRTDPEDIVLSAYRSFFIGVREGRFSIRRSGELWKLLVSITMHKLYRQVRRHRASSRSVHVELPFADDAFDGREPSPEEVVSLSDELQALLQRLDPLARRVLELRLQDETLAAIADDTGRSERTIRRVLHEIKAMMSRRLKQ